MTKDELDELIPLRSYVTYRNADNIRVIGRVLIVINKNEIHLQLRNGREIVKTIDEVKYYGTPGMDCPYDDDYL